MPKLDLYQDILRKQVDEIINDLKVAPVFTKKDVENVRKLIKGFFKDKEDCLKINYNFELESYHLTISGIRHSEGRIFFKFRNSDHAQFSIPISYLLDKDVVFPFKPGDKCVYLNDICDVVKINPASNKITIVYGNRKVKVAVTKVVRFDEDLIG